MFRKYACDEPIDDRLIVNQALSAMPPSTDVTAVLQAMLSGASGAGADQAAPPASS